MERTDGGGEEVWRMGRRRDGNGKGVTMDP